MKEKRNLTGKGEIVYDFKNDILTLRMKDRNYKRSIEFLNFVTDIDEENYPTGVRIFDASKVLNKDKYFLKNIMKCQFRAMVERNVITITINFVSKVRNNILFMKQESFTQQFTTPIQHLHLQDSFVECPSVA